MAGIITKDDPRHPKHPAYDSVRKANEAQEKRNADAKAANEAAAKK